MISMDEDAIREELDANFPEDECDSVHASDVDSNVGEQLDELVNSELDLFELEEVNSEDGNLELIREEEEDGADGYQQEVAEEDEGWKEWKEGDSDFTKFTWLNDSGFKPKDEQHLTSPIDYFQLFFTDDLLSEIVKETNRYAREKIQKVTPLKKRSMWWSWTDVTLEEIKAFLGIVINMGMNPKPEISDYFSTDWVDYQPFFKDVLSKERFQQIFWNLHVSPPPTGPINGSLTRSGKVRNVVLYLDQKFREYYIPSNKVSVDESTVGFKGRIQFKVYNKDKPTKWGIKIFVLSESKTGYICALEPYFGKVTTDRMERQDLGVTSRVVLHLVKKLNDSYGNIEGLHVFCDRYYTNLDLAAVLHQMKVHLTGTIMRNRVGLPEQVKKARKRQGKKNKKEVPKVNLKRGEMKSFRKDDVYHLLIWKDTNDVTMLSTLYNNTAKTVRRVKKGGIMEEVTKPVVVFKYNESMGGVDISDQYISSYGFARKSLKWWRKVFFWLLETSIVNAYLLYNLNKGQGKVRQRKFRKQLIKDLVGNVKNSRKRGRPSDIEDQERLNGKLHILYPLGGKNNSQSKDCAVCSDRSAGGSRKRTKYICKTCTKEPGLCIGDCFERYHSVKNLKA